MTTLLENPMPVIFLGIIAEAMLAVILVSTRQAWALWAILGVLALVLAGVALEWFVVTDVEQVEETLYGVADALETNQWPLIEPYVWSNAVRTRGRAIHALQLVEITSAKVSSLTVTINRLTSPPTAEARFIGTVRYEPRDPEKVPYRYYGRKFVVELRLEGDRWVITDHVEDSEI